MELFRKALTCLENLAKIHQRCIELAMETSFKHLTVYTTTPLPATPVDTPDTKPETAAVKRAVTAADLFDSSEYICLKCRRRYEKSKAWRNHIVHCHPEDVQFLNAQRCEECKLAFARRNLYQRHYLAQHDLRTDEEV